MQPKCYSHFLKIETAYSQNNTKKNEDLKYIFDKKCSMHKLGKGRFIVFIYFHDLHLYVCISAIRLTHMKPFPHVRTNKSNHSVPVVNMFASASPLSSPPPPAGRSSDTEPHSCLAQMSQKTSYLSGACCPGAGGCHAPVTKATGLTTRPETTR